MAAASYDGTIVEYATAKNLKTKDICQWKTSLTKRGFLPVGPSSKVADFVSVQKTNDAATEDASLYGLSHDIAVQYCL